MGGNRRSVFCWCLSALKRRRFLLMKNEHFNYEKSTKQPRKNLSMTAGFRPSSSAWKESSRREFPFLGVVTFSCYWLSLDLQFLKMWKPWSCGKPTKDYWEKKKHGIDTIINRLDCYLTIHSSVVLSTQQFFLSPNNRQKINLENRQLNMRFAVWCRGYRFSV